MSARSMNGRCSAGLPVAVTPRFEGEFWQVFELRHCELADREHAASRRQYAHTFHRRERPHPNVAAQDVICVADAFWRLPKEIRDGIIIHEIGHITAGPEASEAAANEEAERVTGARVEYVDSRYGAHLERAAGPVLPRVERDAEGRVWAGLPVRI